MILFRSWTSWPWRWVPNWPRKYTGNFFIQVVIYISSPTIHISWKCKSFMVWSMEPRSHVTIRRVSTRNVLILNEYAQKSVDSIMKSSRRIRPADTIYQGKVIIQHVKYISEKFRRIWNRFNFWIILEINIHRKGHWWDLDRLRMPSRVSNIQCYCGRYAGVRK
jgi:5-methylcytosine-specific restriction endonuclease McrA